MTRDETSSARRKALLRYLLLLLVLALLVGLLWLGIYIVEFYRPPAWLGLWLRSVAWHVVTTRRWDRPRLT